jgi:hypothetical protein
MQPTRLQLTRTRKTAVPTPADDSCPSQTSWSVALAPGGEHKDLAEMLERSIDAIEILLRYGNSKTYMTQPRDIAIIA